MKRIFVVIILVGFCLICSKNELSSKTIYVKVDAAGLNNGTSWANAYKLLQSALDVSISGDQIWVTKGTYNPTKQVGGTGERFRTFQMKNGVSIYGGFIGNETLLVSRNWKSNETILSGNIGNISDSTDNCYHVFYHPDNYSLDSTAILDGLIIEKGFADNNDGGTFGSGAGIYNDWNSSPTIENCIIRNNTSYWGGGGIVDLSVNNNQSTKLINCVITKNRSNYFCGGGVLGTSCTNCKITDNYAQQGGGGIYSGVRVVNCIISNNISSGYGGGVYNVKLIDSCIIQGNKIISGEGGGIAGGTIKNSIIIENEALNGGGISSGSVDNCIVSNNTANNFGGGVYSSYQVSNSKIIYNKSKNGGGGIYIDGFVENCEISFNQTETVGGGVYMANHSSRIDNCIINNNIAGVEGGGVYIYSSSTIVNVRSCTITNNQATFGAGISSYLKNINIYSSIIFHNIASSNNCKELYLYGNPILTNCCLINNNNDVCGNPTYQNCIFNDPKFIGNSSKFSFSLNSDSPCLDKGYTINQLYDVRGIGYPRQLNKNNGNAGTIDIGAYEFKYGVDPILYPKITIALNQGWNMISSNITPQEPDSLQYVTSDITNNLVLAKNNNGEVYIPSYDINVIGKWDVTQGYNVYMSKADTLKVTGLAVNPSDTQIALYQGWNTISYLRNSELDCESAFASFAAGNVIIVKDNYGNVYIPEYGINTIGNLVTGQGYQVYVLNADVLVYPGN
jgi:hypothetical protein